MGSCGLGSGPQAPASSQPEAAESETALPDTQAAGAQCWADVTPNERQQLCSSPTPQGSWRQLIEKGASEPGLRWRTAPSHCLFLEPVWCLFKNFTLSNIANCSSLGSAKLIWINSLEGVTAWASSGDLTLSIL